MGNLVIKKVRYVGKKYIYDSPELDYGINIIVGDNGSGKSTFTYFIEYGLGGTIKYFTELNTTEKHKEITQDENNYVELKVLINDKNYTLKRFINTTDIFIEDNFKKIFSYPINRSKEKVTYTFSDWLLEQLGIPSFELNLGSITWRFNFNDLSRLLIYDQDTETKKIFKSPSNDNFVTDSVVIRKSIFETLLGISSIEFFKKYDDLRESQKIKDLALAKLTDFNQLHDNININEENLQNLIDELHQEYLDLIKERNLYQSQNTNVSEKTEHLSKIQQELISKDILISELSVEKRSNEVEAYKIEKLFDNLNHEISEIEKIIFTNDKLNLFSLQVCPFCMTKKNPVEGKCICGSDLNDDDYEKFVYNSNEYKNILQYKKKSIQTIETALDSYRNEIADISKKLATTETESNQLRNKLRNIIGAIEFSGNSQFIDEINDKIFELKSDILEKETLQEIVEQKQRLEDDFSTKNEIYKNTYKEYNILKEKFEIENQSTIDSFNEIYKELMKLSSANVLEAEINEDYMPILDGGFYKNKSVNVPKRLMYYFTILSLALKLDRVKHPRILIIDTPETDGIDTENLKHDLLLLTKALELSKKHPSDDVENFQVILTTGRSKYPENFEEFIIERFNTETNQFILSLNK